MVKTALTTNRRNWSSRPLHGRFCVQLGENVVGYRILLLSELCPQGE